MKKLALFFVLVNCFTIYPQWTINGGVDYASFKAKAFKDTYLDNDKYSFRGYFINTGIMGKEYSTLWDILLQYTNRSADVKFNNTNYQLTNGEISLQFGILRLLNNLIGIQFSGDLGIGWIGSNSPLEHSGVYGTASILAGPSVLIPILPFRLFALIKLNVGYINFSSTDPDPLSIMLSSSSDGLISGSEIRVGIGTLIIQ